MRIIIFEGTPEELARVPGWEQLVNGSVARSAGTAGVSVGNSPSAPRRGHSNPEIAKRYLRSLKADARRALLFADSNAPEVSLDDRV